jgi:hypothetical protein
MRKPYRDVLDAVRFEPLTFSRSMTIRIGHAALYRGSRCIGTENLGITAWYKRVNNDRMLLPERVLLGNRFKH